MILPTLLAMSMPIARNAQAGDSADPPGGPCNNDERAEFTVLSLYAAFAEGDTDTILEIIHPDVIWIESDGIPYGGTFIGRDAVFKGVFAKIADEWDDFTAKVDEIFSATGRRVVTLGKDSGTYRTTGRSMVAPTASFWTLNGHCQVVRFEQYIDTLQVRSAIDIEL
jgi:ketosteroid isomerase-like protein